ncbi:MAG: GNAT family N-acetyltransferase [Dehalococcoidia bacterium]
MLTGGKVRLRPKRLGDAFNDYSWARDPELAQLDGTTPTTMPFSEYVLALDEELARSSPGRRFAIETLSGEHIGNCMYYDVDYGLGQVELGILIGVRSYWSQGYGTDAVSVLLGHIFTSMPLKRAYLHTLEWNLRAQKCFERCGFVPRSHTLRTGQRFLVMDIHRQDWESRWVGGREELTEARREA